MLLSQCVPAGQTAIDHADDIDYMSLRSRRLMRLLVVLSERGEAADNIGTRESPRTHAALLAPVFWNSIATTFCFLCV